MFMFPLLLGMHLFLKQINPDEQDPKNAMCFVFGSSAGIWPQTSPFFLSNEMISRQL